MGCLLGCFGHRKNRRRQRRRESFNPRLNRISEESTKDVLLNLRVSNVEQVPKYIKDSSVLEVSKISEVSPEDDHLSVEQVSKVSVIPITDIFCGKVEEKQSLSPSPNRKRVTFDTNVTTYEHIVVDESVELFEEKKEEVKSRQERDITTSNSSGSYPSNHRYQNCRESDDEEEDVTDCDESDLEDIDDGGLLDEDYYNDDNYEDKLHNWDKVVYTEEIADNVMDIKRIEEKSNVSARDRSGYVNAVLNPIENLSQWKAVKSKGRTTQTQPRKENAINASFSLEPQVDELSSSFSLNQKSRDETKKQRTQEIAVDASLSTWLSTSQTTASGCSSVGTAMSEKKKYSKPVQSHDERPILGALTAEEIKQFSATDSPRKSSPSRSPESPIIGTVGGYWNNHSMATSKYS
ncbi:unnamed protein product [Arabidopsis lyrata]|nr:unnamed protein product [Arabidopsis lyrata]